MRPEIELMIPGRIGVFPFIRILPESSAAFLHIFYFRE
jgi:hypothetical protein